MFLAQRSALWARFGSRNPLYARYCVDCVGFTRFGKVSFIPDGIDSPIFSNEEMFWRFTLPHGLPYRKVSQISDSASLDEIIVLFVSCKCTLSQKAWCCHGVVWTLIVDLFTYVLWGKSSEVCIVLTFSFIIACPSSACLTKPSLQVAMRVITRAARVSRRMMMSTAAHPTKNYDIVVVGGGVVGLTFAAEVSQRVKGLKIAVLENKVKTSTPLSVCMSFACSFSQFQWRRTLPIT